MQNEFTSIMMVTYNRLELTKKTLECILNNTITPYELIIVDNGSTDGTEDYLNELPKSNNFKIQLNRENKGIAIGRNQGLKLSEGEWLSTIDNDVLVPYNWLGQCIDILKHNPKYGMIGVNFEGVNYPIVNLNGYEFQNKQQGNLGTACTVFNRKFHKMLGFFNTEYPGNKYGMEDSDFGMRARVIGYNLGYLKENGTHLGEGEFDKGEYREFKTESHNKNLKTFQENCRLYFQGKKPVYIPYKD
jgi:glycosyltransferase involved in cell wall biosynthesis